MLGGPGCFPSLEVCNGKDDDCDGQVDEQGVCDTGSADSGAGGLTGGQDSGAEQLDGSGQPGDGFPVIQPEAWSENVEGSSCACQLGKQRRRGGLLLRLLITILLLTGVWRLRRTTTAG